MTTSQKSKRLIFIDIAINQTIHLEKKAQCMLCFHLKKYHILGQTPLSPSLAEKSCIHQAYVSHMYIFALAPNAVLSHSCCLKQQTKLVFVVVDEGQNRGCVSEELLLRPLSGYNMSTHDQNRSICPILNLC